jgi:predicted nucleotidyltransferase
MSLPPRLDDFPLADDDRRQLAEIVRALDEVLGPALIGAYLHGSAVLGGLRPHSDIDVLALTARETTVTEKDRLIGHLLEISGRYPIAGPPRPIELTVVVGSEVHPWRWITLARIWCCVASGQVMAKDDAAEWALPRLPVEHRPVLARAREIYLGTRRRTGTTCWTRCRGSVMLWSPRSSSLG